MIFTFRLKGPGMERRHFLGVVGGSLVSGCLGGGTTGTSSRTAEGTVSPTADATITGSATNLGDFVLWNDDDESHTVSLVVKRRKELILDIRQPLDPDNYERISNPIDKQGRYQIEASLENGTQTSTLWEITSCHNSQYIQIYINDSGKIKIYTKQQTIVPTPSCE